MAHKVIALIDIDSYECQVYKRSYPQKEYYGKAWIVADHTGRIVSATHAAKEMGISRDIRLGEARRISREKKIPLVVFHKRNEREKPDNKEVRYGTWDIVDALKEYKDKYTYKSVLECASSDEFYLDITEEVELRIRDAHFGTMAESRTFLEMEHEQVSGNGLINVICSERYRCPRSEEVDQERRLLCGGLIMQEIKNFLFSKTKFIGSVGVGSNKLMAKLAVNMNKPDGITILTHEALPRVGKELKIEKIPGFGKSTGVSVKEQYNIKTMCELNKISLDVLERDFGLEKALDIFFRCRGISEDPVKEKLMTDAVSCGKSYYFRQIISDETLHFYLYQLVDEMYERLIEERLRHKRTPKFLRFSVNYVRLGDEDTEDKDSNWSLTTNYERHEPCYNVSLDVMNQVLERFMIDYKAIKITRIEVRTKEFVPVG